MKSIVLLRSTDGDPDSRFQKYIWFLESTKIPFKALCWDRNLTKTDTQSYKYYHSRSSYGTGVSNIRKLILFNVFLLKNLIKDHRNISVIHAADFDTILPAIVMRILFRKKVIYDIYDWYIDSRRIESKILTTIIKSLEFCSIKLSDKVIICEPERERQIHYRPKSLWILPNIPNFKKRLNPTPTHNSKLTISYVGILDFERGLENLARLGQENPNIILKVGGFGPLSYLFTEKQLFHNINFYGSVSYVSALEIMSTSDLIYACYETSNRNHILAAPNKYYEGLYLGIPIITTKGTIVGDKTTLYDTGFSLGEEYEDLASLINTLTPEIIRNKGLNAKKLWEDKYEDYVIKFLNEEYFPFIHKAISS